MISNGPELFGPATLLWPSVRGELVAESYRSEYVGFTVNDASREYSLRVTTPGSEARTFTVAISNKAFLTHRVRYQDAPDICFLKLQRALAECAELPAARLTVTDGELDEYRESHSARPAKNWPRHPGSSSPKPEGK
jgi:hypothetical protein